MLKFIARRLWYGSWVFFGVVTVVFFLFTILPGDPARMMLGQRADIAAVEAIHKELGLHRPVWVQYLNWLNDLSPVSVHHASDSASFFFHDPQKYTSMPMLNVGEYVVVAKVPYLRRSYQSGREVLEILTTALPNTLLLAVVSILFAMMVGIALGAVSVLWQNVFISRTITVLSVLGMSVPSFFAAIIIAWLFGFLLADFTGLSMTGSLVEVDDFGRGKYLEWKNLILPALTLGIRPMAVVSELTRSSLTNVMAMDYIRTARAKGLGRSAIIVHHAMRNALNPVVTAISGWFASLMAGAVFVEYIFNWKGIGVVIVDALEHYDFPVIMGAVLVIAVLLVLLNILVDITYGILDPRVRLQ